MKRRRCRLIYFFGPDGAGKTTYADAVASYLAWKGHRVWRTSVKHHHFLAYLILRLISRLAGMRSGGVVSYVGFGREAMEKSRAAWKAAELLSLLAAVIYRVKIPLLLGYLVICDRYIADSLATLSLFLREPEMLNGTLARLLLKLIPSDSVIFHLDADVSTILMRKRDEPLTATIIKYYKLAYSIIQGLLGVEGYSIVKIDTSNNSISEVRKQIIGAVRNCI